MKILRKLENIFSAAAFAEAGEFETAKQMATEDVGEETKKKVTQVEGKKHTDEGDGEMTPYSTRA